MNIVYHHRVRGTGGEVVHIAGIINGFRNSGHLVTVVSPMDIDLTNPTPTNKMSGLTLSKVYHFFANYAPQIIFEMGELYYNLSGIIKLSRLLANLKYDVIYERYAFFNLAGCHISKKFNIPLIVEVNELCGYDRIRKQVMIPLAKKIESLIFRQACLIVVVSDFLKFEISKILGTMEKIIVVPNGVSENWFKQSTIQIDQHALLEKHQLRSKKILGFVGALSHWHNFDFLLNLVADLKKEFSDLVILIIGDGSMKKEIIATAQRLKIIESVKILGTVSHTEIINYLNLFDIAIVPHSNEYRSPIKLFEYMAAGKPIVAPATPPICAVIQHLHDGILFTPGNHLEAYTAIKTLLTNHELRYTIGKNAQQKIKENYLWEIHSKRIIDELLKINN